MKTPCTALLGILLAGFLIPHSPLAAATFQWTGNSAGGNNWSDAGNWSGGVPDNNGTAQLNFFNSSRTAPNVDTAWSVAHLIFMTSSTAYTLGGQQLTLTGSISNESGGVQTIVNPLVFTSGGSIVSNTGSRLVLGSTAVTTDTISHTTGNLVFSGDGDVDLHGVISGAGTLVKLGDGRLTITPTQTFTGGFRIASGVVDVGGSGFVLGNGMVTLEGGTIGISGTTNLNQLVTIENTGGTWHVLTGTPFLSSKITGPGKLTKTGPGNLRLSSPLNDYSGGTQVDGGTLAAFSTTLKGSVVNNATVELGTGSGGNTNGSYSGTMTGTGGLLKTGVSIYTLTGASITLDGAADIQGGEITGAGYTFNTGALSIQNGAVMAFTGTGNSLTTGALTVAAGGTLTLPASAGAITTSIGALSGGGVVNMGASTLNAGVGGADSTFSGSFQGGGTLRKKGAGTLSLTGASSSSRGSTVEQGTLYIRHNDALGGDDGSCTVLSGGTLRLDGGIASPAFLGINLAGSGAGGGGALRKQSSSSTADSSVNGVVTLTSDARIVNADTTCALILAAGTQIDGHVLTVAGGGSVQMPGAIFAGGIIGGGMVDVRDTGTRLIMTGNQPFFSGGINVFEGTLDIQHEGGLGQGGGVIDVKNGAVMQIAPGVSLSTNKMVKIAGQLIGGNGASFSTSAELQISSSGSIETLSNAQFTLQSGGEMTGGNATFHAEGASSQITWSMGSDLTGNVTKTGAGVLLLSGNKDWEGATFINAGTLRLGGGNAIPDTSTVTVASGAALDLAGFAETLAGLAGDGSVTLGSGGALTFGSATTTFSGGISGAGTVTKTGGGTSTLSGASTYTGATSVLGGILIINADNRLGTPPASATASHLILGSALRIASSMTLDSRRGIEVQGSGNISVDSNFTAVYDGVIAGSGALNITGLGFLSLGGANTHSGATSVISGRLLVRNNHALGTAAGNTTVQSFATLVLDGGIDLTAGAGTREELRLNGSGFGGVGALRREALSSTGTTRASGNLVLNSSSRVVNAAAGPLHLADAALGSTIQISVHTLTLMGQDDIFLSGSITGSGTVSAGTDTRVILAAGSAAYTGGFQVTSGALHVAAAQALGTSGGGITVASGARLSTEPGIAVTTGKTVSLSGEFSGGAGGSWSGAGDIQAASTAQLSAGNFTLGGAGKITGSSALALAATAGGVFTIERVIEISAGAGIVKSGPGTVALNAAMSWNGATQVTAGTLRLAASNTLPDTTTVEISTGAVLDVNGFSDGVAGLSGVGTVTLGSGGALTVGLGNVTRTFDGAISGPGTLVKSGSGLLALTGALSHTATTLGGGSLRVSGSHSGTLLVQNNAVLGGTGTIGGSVTLDSGSIEPGAGGVGVLTLGSGLDMSAGGILHFEIGGTGRGNGHDALVIAGNLQRNGIVRVVLVNGFTPAAGQSFDLFDAGSSSGGFTSLDLPGLPAHLSWNTDLLHDQGILSVEGVTVSYQDWTAQFTFSLPDDSQPAADPDFDGMVNYYEYMLGTHPLTADNNHANLPRVHTVQHSGQPHLALTYKRPAGEQARPANLNSQMRVMRLSTLPGIPEDSETTLHTSQVDGDLETRTYRSIFPLRFESARHEFLLLNVLDAG